jgi:exonuclease III
MKMKLFVWNINQRRSGQEIPLFVSEEIMNADKEDKADIVVLTEFISAAHKENIEKFIESLNEKYECFYNIDRKDGNGVLIAIRKDFVRSNNVKINKPIECMEINNKKQQEQPNFLQLDMIVNEKPISIIGTRIRIGTTCRSDLIERREQVLSLIDHIDELKRKEKDKKKYKNIIIAGDFNNLKIYGKESEYYLTERKHYHGKVLFDTYNYHILKDDFFNYAEMNVSTPESESELTWSWVGKGRCKPKFKEDHIILKGFKVSDKKYSWDFVKKDNGYGDLKPEDYKSHLVGFPDHAILTADVELDEPFHNEEDTK